MKAFQNFINILTALAGLGAALSIIFYVATQTNTNNAFVFGSNNKVDQKIEPAPNSTPSPVPSIQPQPLSVQEEKSQETSSAQPEVQDQVSGMTDVTQQPEPKTISKTETAKVKPKRKSVSPALLDYINEPDNSDYEENDYQEVSEPVRNNCPRVVRYPVQVVEPEEEYQSQPRINQSSRSESYQETYINGVRTVRRVVTTRNSRGVTKRVFNY